MDWQAEPLSPLEREAFQPALAAPGPEVPDYTPDIEQALLGVFRPAGWPTCSLPLLALLGNKGGGKSTLLPSSASSTAGVRRHPLSDDPRDLLALAKMRLCFALDNVDAERPPWLVEVCRCGGDRCANRAGSGRPTRSDDREMGRGAGHQSHRLFRPARCGRAHPTAHHGGVQRRPAGV